MAAGVAHELRNPLQFIKNFAEASQLAIDDLAGNIGPDDTADSEEAIEMARDLAGNMETIVRHSDRANSIVSQMTAIGRHSTGTFQPADLNRLVDEQTSLAYQSIKAQIPDFSADITLKLAPDLQEVTVVPEDLGRVITNMVSNACQAMAAKITSSEENYTPHLTIETRQAEDGAVITFRDNGTGINPEIQDRMFNPFFTTRDSTRNTGLGLTMSHDIVREHGGSIATESEVGQYTKITVFLSGKQLTAESQED